MAEFNMDQFEQDYRNERRKALRNSYESGETSFPALVLQHGANRIGERVSDTVQGIGAFAKSLYNNPQAVAEAGAEGLEDLYNRIAQGDAMAAMEVAGMVATGGATAAIAKGARLADFATFDPNTSRMFIGDIGAKNLADAGKPVAQKVLQVARQMKMMGATETEIRAKTNQIIEKEDPSLGGVSFNSEGRLVVEIDDSKMAVRSDSAIERATGGYQTPAGGMYFSTDIDNVLKGTPLGKAYPKEINMKVSDVSEAPRENVLGSFDENTNTITSFALKTDVPGVTAHELQHFIQAREGFPRGGNEIDALDGMYGNMANDYDEISTLLRQFNGKPIPNNVYQQFENPEIMRASLSKIRRDHEGDDDAAADFAENQAITIRDDPEDWAKTIYSYLAGEVEARNVQTRLKMTPAERRATPPSETETDARFKMPLLREDQIISKRAQGGEVMQGIGTLNETARNMFRGPSGVGAYQQFADGGEADMSEAELKRLEALYGGSMFNNFDIPVDGKVNFRTTEDGRQMFDAEIAKTFDGERGNITPSARYSTQRGSRSMGDVVIDDEGRQIAVAFEGNLYVDPNSENKLRAAIDIENSRQKTSFSFPDGEFVETKNGVLKKFNLGFDFGRLAVNFDHVEPSGQPNKTSGSATIRIGENGIFKFQDSQGKEPEYSFNYNTDVGDGTGSLNYQEDGRNDPKLGMGYTTPIGEGVGSLNFNTNGDANEFGVKYTTNFASGGEAMGPPPTRGPDPQGIGAFQQFADGGPVYMQEGGTGRDALASNHFDLIKEKYPSVDPLKISQEEGLPPQLISVFQRLLFQENQSADASAVGTSGEIGLAQLMPVTAKDVGVNRDNLTDNVRGGARYLFKMYNRFGQDPMTAVAAYNAGPTAVVDNLDRNDGQLNIGQLPSTTQSYLGFVVQPVLNQTEVAQTIDPMMAGEDLAMSMPVAQSDYLSPEAQENIRQGTQFQGGSPTGVLSIGEQIRREKFKPNVSFEGQEMEAMPVNLRDKYSSKNMQEQLVGGQETLDKGIAGLTRSLRPPFRPEEEMREPQDRYPGTNTDIGEGFGIYI